MAGLTPFQTAGPYLLLGMRAACSPMTTPHGGPTITIQGRVLDGAGQGVPDGVLEFWHPAFSDIGRVHTAEGGAYTLTAVKPPSVDGAEGARAPHFAMRVMGRGILTQYWTRVYFDDEASTAADPILALVPEARRSTIIARATAPGVYQLDVVLQGPNETVFFDA